MYSNSKKGFSILDLLVKIIFAALLIFIIVWLFQKKIPKINLNPFYSNVFRENIKYMQEAGESYFTDDKMPTEIGESSKLTLEEMEKMNIIVPFVDKDGNSCDINNSYVSITKLDDGYELKTYLICGKESKYIVKTLGCHNYCPNGNCEKTCRIEKITENEFKKLVTGTKTVYSCPKGYKLNGKNCIKSKLIDSKSAIVTTTETRTLTKPAIADVISGKKKLIDTIVTSKKQLVETSVKENKTLLTTIINENKQQLTTIKTYVPATTRTDKVPYDCSTTEKVKVPYTCTKTKTEQSCTTIYQTQSYQCGNCRTVLTSSGNVKVCDICYKTVPVQSCKDIETTYTDTCYREETRTTQKTCYRDVTTTVTAAHYDYSCPTGTTIKEGTGSSLKCYKTVKTYSCPAETTVKEGTGSSLKCYKTVKTYSCPAETTDREGTGSSLKCYKTVKTYSCPASADIVEGTGSNTKCYKVTEGSVKYSCESGWTLNGKNCTKVEKTTKEEKTCKNSKYVLEGNKCNLYKTTKVKATSKKVNTKSYEYKWSTADTLAGYTKTGKTRSKDGEKICD